MTFIYPLTVSRIGLLKKITKKGSNSKVILIISSKLKNTTKHHNLRIKKFIKKLKNKLSRKSILIIKFFDKCNRLRGILILSATLFFGIGFDVEFEKAYSDYNRATTATTVIRNSSQNNFENLNSIMENIPISSKSIENLLQSVNEAEEIEFTKISQTKRRSGSLIIQKAQEIRRAKACIKEWTPEALKNQEPLQLQKRNTNQQQLTKADLEIEKAISTIEKAKQSKKPYEFLKVATENKRFWNFGKDSRKIIRTANRKIQIENRKIHQATKKLLKAENKKREALINLRQLNRASNRIKQAEQKIIEAKKAQRKILQARQIFRKYMPDSNLSKEVQKTQNKGLEPLTIEDKEFIKFLLTKTDREFVSFKRKLEAKTENGVMNIKTMNQRMLLSAVEEFKNELQRTWSKQDEKIYRQHLEALGIKGASFDEINARKQALNGPNKFVFVRLGSGLVVLMRGNR